MNKLPDSKKYVVIGAGVHGLSSAWHLAMELKARGRGSGVDVIVGVSVGPCVGVGVCDGVGEGVRVADVPLSGVSVADAPTGSKMASSGGLKRSRSGSNIHTSMRGMARE